MMKPYSDRGLDPPQELIDEFAKGRVALFLGAGISMPAGAPDLESLIEPLRKKLPYLGADSLDLPQVVSLINLHRGPSAFQELVRLELQLPRQIEVHELIVQLPTEMILTTNYDPYLFQAAQRADLAPVVVDEDRLVSLCGESGQKIVHLYGNTKNPLASEEDLITFDRCHPALALLLEHTLITRTVLFLGFSLRDYNVLNHLLTAQSLVGTKRPHYAFMLMTKHNEAQVHLWDSRQLRIFGQYDVPPDKMSDAFITFVKKLAGEVKPKTHAKLEREMVVYREESNYLARAKTYVRKPHMRRESTFSVLAIPDDFALSGMEKPGHELGLKRKKIYEQWIKEGQIDLILNIDSTYAEDVRGYRTKSMLAHLRELRSCITRHLEDPGLAVAARTYAVPRDSYASLGDDVLITSDTPARVKEKVAQTKVNLRTSEETAYKRTSVLRDRMAIKVFNEFFDQEMDNFIRVAVENRTKGSVRDDKKRRRIGKLETIAKIEALIRQLK